MLGPDRETLYEDLVAIVRAVQILEVQRDELVRALLRMDFDRSMVAHTLGIDPATLYRRYRPPARVRRPRRTAGGWGPARPPGVPGSSSAPFEGVEGP